METIITSCGWVLFALLTAAIVAFAVAFIWGCGYLGFRLSIRFVRERKGWKRAVKEGDYKITRHAALVISDRLGYGRTATLEEVINDTTKKIVQ